MFDKSGAKVRLFKKLTTKGVYAYICTIIILRSQMELTLDGRRGRSAIVILLLIVGALAFRRYDAFLNPQLWAEDGIVFLQQHYDLGLRALTTPYAGYLNTAQRLIVLFFGGIGFNMLYIPTLYCVTIGLIMWGIGYRLWLSSASLGIRNRIAYAVMFVFVPITSDVFLNITNLNGILSLYLINRLFIKEHGIRTTAGWVLDTLVILVISLSGPASILLCPVIAVMLVMERRTLNWRRLLPMLLILACGIVQLIYVKFIDPGFYRGTEGATEPYHVLKFFVKNMGDALYMQDPMMGWMFYHTRMIVSAVALALFGAFFVRSYMRWEDRNKYILLLAATFYTASVIYSYWPNESYLFAMRNASRYFIVPYTCMGWMLLLALDKKLGRVGIGVYLLFFLFHRPHMQFLLPDKQWKAQIMEYREGKREMIDINPDGWKFRLPPHVQR